MTLLHHHRLLSRFGRTSKRRNVVYQPLDCYYYYLYCYPWWIIGNCRRTRTCTAIGTNHRTTTSTTGGGRRGSGGGMNNHHQGISSSCWSDEHNNHDLPNSNEEITRVNHNNNNSKTTTSSHIVDVTDLADRMRQLVRNYVAQQPSATTTDPTAASTASAGRIKLAGVMADTIAKTTIYSTTTTTADAGVHIQHPRRTDADCYAAQIAQTFQEDGLDYEQCHCRADRPEEVESLIRTLNDRPDIHGVLVFYPIFRKKKKQVITATGLVLPNTNTTVQGPYMNRMTGVRYKTYDDYIRDVVCPKKDVEGLCTDYKARWIFRARGGTERCANEVYLPCTALSVIRILEAYHPMIQSGGGGGGGGSATNRKPWSGCNVTILNRSEVFGRPLAALLALEGANVYSVDEQSILLFTARGRLRRCTGITLQQCLSISSIVVLGVPDPGFVLPSEFIAPGTTLINVAEHNNFDEETILLRPNVRLIPRIGKITVAALEHNLIRLHGSILRQPGQ